MIASPVVYPTTTTTSNSCCCWNTTTTSGSSSSCCTRSKRRNSSCSCSCCCCNTIRMSTKITLPPPPTITTTSSSCCCCCRSPSSVLMLMNDASSKSKSKSKSSTKRTISRTRTTTRRTTSTNNTMMMILLPRIILEKLLFFFFFFLAIMSSVSLLSNPPLPPFFGLLSSFIAATTTNTEGGGGRMILLLFVNGEEIQTTTTTLQRKRRQIQQQQQQEQQQQQLHYDRPNPLFQLEPFAIPPPQYNSNSSSFDLTSPTTFRQNVCERQQKLYNTGSESEINNNNANSNELFGTALQGLELRVIINENQYFQLVNNEDDGGGRHIPTEEGEYPGLMVVILDELAKRGQFTWRNSFATYNSTTNNAARLLLTEGNNKTLWDDLLLYWSTQTYDLSVDNWILSTNRMNKYHVSFIEPWFYDATPILVASSKEELLLLSKEEEEDKEEVLLESSSQSQSQQQQEENSGSSNNSNSSFDVLAFGKPFSPSVWFCMVATIIFSGLVYMFLQLVDPYSDTRGSKLNYQPIENMYLTALGFTGHMEFQPRTHPARLFTLSIAFWALLMAASYTANLANFLIAGDLSSSTSSSTTSSSTIQSSSAEEIDNNNVFGGVDDVLLQHLLEQAMINDEGNGIINSNNKSICLLEEYFGSSSLSIKDDLLREYPNLNITEMTNEVDTFLSDDCVATILYESSWTNYWKHQSIINDNCSLRSYGSVSQLLTTTHRSSTTTTKAAAGGFATTSDSGILCTSLIHDVINLHMMEMKQDGFLDQAWEEFIENTKTNDCTTSREEGVDEDESPTTTSSSGNNNRRRLLSHSATATATASSSSKNVDGGCTASSIESSSLSSTTTSNNNNNNNNIRRRRKLKGINKRTGGGGASSQEQTTSGTTSSTAIQLDLNNMGGIFILHLFISVFAMAFALVHRWTGLTARRNKELREKNLRLQLKRMAANRKLSQAQSVSDRKRGIQEMLTLQDESDDCPGFLFENNSNNAAGGNNGSNPMRGRRLGGRLSLGGRESNADESNNNNNNALGGVSRGGSSASIDVMAGSGGTTGNSSRDEDFSLDQSIQALLNAIGNNKDTMWEDNFDNIHLQQDHQLDAIVDLQQQIDVSNKKQDEQTKAMLEMKDQLTTMMNMMMKTTTTTSSDYDDE